MVAAIALTPDNGPVATVVEIAGTGYALNEVITFLFDGVSIAANEGIITSDGAGAFTVHITTPAHAAGVVPITATDVSLNTDDANFTVKTVPAAPVLTKTDMTGTAVKFSWPAPADGSSALTGYTIQTSLDVGFSSPASNSVASGSDPTTYEKTGLTELTPYWFRVKATNAIGDSAWSNVVSVTTEETLPKITFTGVSDFVSTLHAYKTGKKIDIVIDDDAFDDICVIDARGNNETQIQLKNTHGSKGLIYEIQGMTEETATPLSYSAAVYSVEDAGGTIAAGANVIKQITKCYSWLLVRAKRQTAGPTNDSQLAVHARAK